jgi:ferric iron reductase protein FhuF
MGGKTCVYPQMWSLSFVCCMYPSVLVACSCKGVKLNARHKVHNWAASHDGRNKTLTLRAVQ